MATYTYTQSATGGNVGRTLEAGDRVNVNAGVTLTNTGSTVVFTTVGAPDAAFSIDGALRSGGGVIDGGGYNTQLTVWATGSLVSTTGLGLPFIARGGAKVMNAGLMQGRHALFLSGDGHSVTNTGQMLTFAKDQAAVIIINGTDSLTGRANLVFNSGVIASNLYIGFEHHGTGLLSLTNSGTIRSDSADRGHASLRAWKGALKLENAGSLIGGVISADEADEVHNLQGGVITGSLDVGAGTDTVRNTGWIKGAVNLGDGADTFDGLSGRVDGVISGGGGADFIRGSAQPEAISGGTGQDRLFGWDGNDLIHGDEDDDVIDGGWDADVLYGGDGNDTLLGDHGADSLRGGFGRDILHGGEHDDILEGEYNEDVLYGGDGRDGLWGGSEADVLYGEADDDRLMGGEGEDRLFGGDGADLLFGDSGFDELSGGFGADTLSGGYGFDVLYGNQDNDVLYGNQDGDVLYGGQGNDSVYGGQGGDVLYGNLGDDLLFGNLGEDRVHGGAGTNLLDGGDGIDLASWIDAVSGVTVSLMLLGQAQATGASTDTLVSIEWLQGSRFADVLTGDAGANLLIGDEGNDTLHGGHGEDDLWGEAGNDVLYGNQDADDLRGADGSDTLYGGQGDDLLDGGRGDDLIFGNLGADKIYVALAPGRDTIGGFELGGVDKLWVFDSSVNSFSDAMARAVAVDGGTLFSFAGDAQVFLVGIAPSQLTDACFEWDLRT